MLELLIRRSCYGRADSLVQYYRFTQKDLRNTMVVFSTTRAILSSKSARLAQYNGCIEHDACDGMVVVPNIKIVLPKLPSVADKINKNIN